MSEDTKTSGTNRSRREIIKLSAAGLVAGAAVLSGTVPPVFAAGGKKMKVVLVNGSPNSKGCTFTGLKEAANTLNEEGIEAPIFQVGREPVSGCIACFHCAQTGRCRISDCVNEFVEIAEDADGFMFGTPVHFGAAGGAITSFMDRAFFTQLCAEKDTYYLKPVAAIASARRSGPANAVDQLNKYFTMMEMPIMSSIYWNMVHGSKAEDVKQDLEGLQTLRILARNMAWFLRCKEAGVKNDVPMPKREAITRTNFIR